MGLNVDRIIEKLKQPSMIYNFRSKRVNVPNLNSHFGGYPYFEKGEKVPVCKKCCNIMNFIFQLNIPNEDDQGSKVYCFYYCNNCNIEEGNKGFEMRIYENPSLQKVVKKDVLKSKIIYSDMEFDIFWSMPEWGSLPFIDNQVQELFYDNHKENAEIEYEKEVEKFVGSNTFDEFSFFGGYPKFLDFAFYPECPHCKEDMELFLQVDTAEDLGIHWSDYGCLYIFRCKNNSNQFFILIQ